MCNATQLTDISMSIITISDNTNILKIEYWTRMYFYKRITISQLIIGGSFKMTTTFS
jgi:hypothetical protein